MQNSILRFCYPAGGGMILSFAAQSALSGDWPMTSFNMAAFMALALAYVQFVDRPRA